MAITSIQRRAGEQEAAGLVLGCGCPICVKTWRSWSPQQRSAEYVRRGDRRPACKTPKDEYQ